MKFLKRVGANNKSPDSFCNFLKHAHTERWDRIFEEEDSDPERIKKHFLEAPVFDGKSFWQVEKSIAWLEEGNPVVRSSDTTE